MGEDTKKPNPQSTTTPSSQEQQQKKEETIQDSPTAPATETAAQKQDDTDILQTLLQQTSTPPPSKDSKVRSNDSAASPPTPPDPPNNSPTVAPPPDPPQPSNGDAKQGKDKGKSWVDGVKDFITILGGSTVVIVALFVFVGRRYAEGYFNALNIPNFSVTFSTWDYGERGILPVLFSVIAGSTVYLFLAFFALLSISQIWKKVGRPNVGHFINWLCSMWSLLEKIKDGIKAIINWIYPVFLPIIQTVFTFFRLGIIFVVLMFVISNMLLRAYNEGKDGAYTYIQGHAVGVRLISKEPFLISASNVTAATVTANDEPTYTYEGLYLLTDNDGTYFLFDDVDEMCSPTNVYIVQEAQLLSVEFIPETFSKSCTPPTDTSPTPTVTPTTVPTTTPIPQATPTPMP